MAARSKKTKEHRVLVTDIAQWNKELEFPGLLVVELYNSYFGPCESMVSSIASFAVDLGDDIEHVKWLLVNVVKLEDNEKDRLVEEEKKKHQSDSMQKRRSSTTEPLQTEESAPTQAEEATAFHDKIQVAIPKLEKYTGYDHPKPLWVLIKNGVVVNELRGANPPLMRKLIVQHIHAAPEPMATNIPPIEEYKVPEPTPAAVSRSHSRVSLTGRASRGSSSKDFSSSHATDNTAVDASDQKLADDQAEPQSAEPQSAEPQSAELSSAESQPIDSAAAEVVSSEPVAAEPATAEPVAAEPVAAEPVAAEPVAAEPVAAEAVAAQEAKCEADALGASIHDSDAESASKAVSSLKLQILSAIGFDSDSFSAPKLVIQCNSHSNEIAVKMEAGATTINIDQEVLMREVSLDDSVQFVMVASDTLPGGLSASCSESVHNLVKNSQDSDKSKYELISEDGSVSYGAIRVTGSLC